MSTIKAEALETVSLPHSSVPCRGDLTIRVDRVVRHTDEINSYVLQRIDGLPLPACEAGAHVDVYLPGGLASLRTETFRGWRDSFKVWWTETKDDLSGETKRRKLRETQLRERRDVF